MTIDTYKHKNYTQYTYVLRYNKNLTKVFKSAKPKHFTKYIFKINNSL